MFSTFVSFLTRAIDIMFCCDYLASFGFPSLKTTFVNSVDYLRIAVCIMSLRSAGTIMAHPPFCTLHLSVCWFPNGVELDNDTNLKDVNIKFSHIKHFESS